MAEILPGGGPQSPVNRFSGDKGVSDAFQKLVGAQWAGAGPMGAPPQPLGMMPGMSGPSQGGLFPAALQQIVQALSGMKG